ncbi:MAG: hypothetical protein HFE30_02805 [Clostridiales bacterium]|nr:hypothetical protein [Clostridiales bacterium]
MVSGKPTVRQIAWISIIPQMLFMAFLGVVYFTFIESKFLAAYLTCLTYLIVSFTLRLSLTHNHRKGMILIRDDKYELAIDEFQKSYSFFSKHAWIDRYRFITMLSSSKISYSEMALVNIAFCYSQIGDGRKTKDYYLKALDQFPNSEIVKTFLKTIESIENSIKVDNISNQTKI